MSLIDLPLEELQLNKALVEKGYKLHGVVKTDTGRHVVVSSQGTETIVWYVDENGVTPRGFPALARKPIKKTFIKTLKELVDSGWDLRVGRSMTCLVHPDTLTTFNIEMLKHCGEERATVGQVCEQNKWHWTSEMLIKKEA